MQAGEERTKEPRGLLFFFNSANEKIEKTRQTEFVGRFCGSPIATPAICVWARQAVRRCAMPYWPETRGVVQRRSPDPCPTIVRPKPRRCAAIAVLEHGVLDMAQRGVLDMAQRVGAEGAKPLLPLFNKLCHSPTRSSGRRADAREVKDATHRALAPRDANDVHYAKDVHYRAHWDLDRDLEAIDDASQMSDTDTAPGSDISLGSECGEALPHETHAQQE